MYEDDPDAPPSEEEKRAAAALRNALERDEETGAPRTSEGKWLAAHLRLPSSEDALGDVRAWRLARGARESMMARRAAAEQQSDGFSRLGRSLTSTGGLLAAAAMLLIVSWLIVGQGQRAATVAGGAGGQKVRALQASATSMRAAQTIIYQKSFKRAESPAKRLDLMIEMRLAELRNPPASETPARSFSAAALSLLHAGNP
jgi:hypothetical protein